MGALFSEKVCNTPEQPSGTDSEEEVLNKQRRRQIMNYENLSGILADIIGFIKSFGNQLKEFIDGIKDVVKGDNKL